MVTKVVDIPTMGEPWHGRWEGVGALDPLAQVSGTEQDNERYRPVSDNFHCCF